MLIILKLMKENCYLPFIQRAIFALCLLQLNSCTPPLPRQWNIQFIRTQCPRFNSGKMFLEPDSGLCYLDLELLRNASGIRIFLNLLLLEAPPWKEDPSRTTLSVFFEEREPWIVHPFLLEGGQRLLFSGEDSDKIIEELMLGNEFLIQIGRHQIRVVSTNFTKALEELMDLPIEECAD